MESRVRQHFSDSIETKQAASALAPDIVRAGELMIASLKDGGKILSCGNGGSAADAQHFAAELVGRFELERTGLPAVALTTDSSNLTAIANDYGFDQVFARQVSALGTGKDVLLAISTSGNSPNVVAAIESAQAQGLPVVALTVRDRGKMAGMTGRAYIELRVPSERTTRIQETHLVIIHALCDLIDQALVD